MIYLHHFPSIPIIKVAGVESVHVTTVVSSANLMIELEACVATQWWGNREYRRGLRTHPCGAPRLGVRALGVWCQENNLTLNVN